MSIEAILARTNEFITKVLESTKAPNSKPVAKPKGLAKAKGKPDQMSDTLEEALEAAFRCAKCVATRQGTKGCRQCMGERFEQIRIKSTP